MKRIVSFLALPILLLSLAGPAIASQPVQASRQAGAAKHEQWLANQVRHRLVTLPLFSVFDNLEYEVQADTVILQGQVVHATLKDDAEATVKKIEGVERVINRIEILPPSFNDDRIRRAEFRSIYSQPMLQRLTLSSVPSIHIIVRGGRVELFGVVANQAQKDAANVQANLVPGVFSVTNNLAVEKRG